MWKEQISKHISKLNKRKKIKYNEEFVNHANDSHMAGNTLKQ